MVKVKMNSAGCRAVLNSEGVQHELLSQARRMCDAANSIDGTEHVCDVRPGRNRAHAMVKTSGIRSIRANLKHNTLLKAFGR